MDPIECILPPGADLPPCDERIAALHRYWRSIHPAERRFPGRQHVDPSAIPALLPWLWIIDVQQSPRRFKYRLIGTEQVRVMGRDRTGQWLDEAFPDFADGPNYGQFMAAADGMICYRRGFPVVHVSKDFLLSERVLLPMARDGVTVDMLLALSLYRLAGSGRQLSGTSTQRILTAQAQPARRDDPPETTSPLLLRLWDDWRQRRAGREFPRRADFDPVDLKYILGALSLIDVGYAPLRFRFRLHGSENAARVGVDLTGKDLGAFPSADTRTLIRAQYEAVIAKRAPRARAGGGTFLDGKSWRYDVLTLPLSSDGGTIDMLMSAVVWTLGPVRSTAPA